MIPGDLRRFKPLLDAGLAPDKEGDFMKSEDEEKVTDMPRVIETMTLNLDVNNGRTDNSVYSVIKNGEVLKVGTFRECIAYMRFGTNK